MRNFFISAVAFLAIAVFTGCEKNDDPKEENNGYRYGIYVINEGAYNANNGSISFVNESNTVIINDIFNAANGRPLGDIVQSFSVINDSMGIIVVNHSARLEFVRLTSFQTVSEPLHVEYPRYFLQVDDEKGYVTSGSLAGKVYVIDLSSNSISDSIDVGFGPEVLVKRGNLVYVANSGGWGSDSTLSVINPVNDEIENIIPVQKVPVDLAIDHENYIWVYCKGYTNYSDIETDSYLQKIDPDNKLVIWQAKVGKALDYASTPAKCAVSADGSKVYFIRPDGIYMINASTPVIAESPFIPGNYYGLDINPENDRIYVFESSFTGNGTMKIYEPDGVLFGQGTVGIGPNGAVFNLQ